MFYAGEHGGESIEIRPNALGDKKDGGSGTTLVFQPGSIVVQGNRAEDFMRQLRRLGLNAIA